MLCRGKRILLIVNPTAGKMKSKSGMFDIVEMFRKNGAVTTVLTTVEKGDATAIARQYAQDHDIVVCCGGDGTLNEVITGLMQANCRVPLGYVPAGTTNDMANTLAIPKGIKRATQCILAGEPVPQDIGLFNKSLYFSYVASFGAFTKVSYATPQWLKNHFGHFAYVLDGIKRVGEIKPYRVKVESPKFSLEDNVVFGSVTNAKSVGGTFKMRDEDVCLNDGKFEVMLIRNPHNPVDLRSILYGLTHQKYDEEHVLFFHTDQITFTFPNEVPWTVDGEFAGDQKKVQIQNLPRAVSLIRREALSSC